MKTFKVSFFKPYFSSYPVICAVVEAESLDAEAMLKAYGLCGGNVAGYNYKTEEIFNDNKSEIIDVTIDVITNTNNTETFCVKSIDTLETILESDDKAYVAYCMAYRNKNGVKVYNIVRGKGEIE